MIRHRLQRTGSGGRWTAALLTTMVVLVPGTVVALSLPPDPPERAEAAADEPPELQVDEVVEASLSTGDTSRGELRGGVEVPTIQPGLQRLSVVARRGTGWGTRDLVSLIVRVADELARLPDHQTVPLRVGNLSRRQGGDLRWSHSHASGRDADFAFYLLNADGEPTMPDGYVALDGLGQGKVRHKPVSFDISRNWNAVRALLVDSQVQVQHLFIAVPLRQLLLSHARAQGEPEWLVERASLVLSEPAYSGRHDDHLHIRLYCNRDDRLAGCIDEGPRWSWVTTFEPELKRHVSDLMAELGEPDLHRRVEAVRRLAVFQRDQRVVDALVWAASSGVPELRWTALDGLARFRRAEAFAPLMAAARREPDGAVTQELLAAAIRLARPANASDLYALLRDDAGGFSGRLDVQQRSVLRQVVVRAVRPWLLESTVAPVLLVLNDPDVTTRRAALRTLEHLANRRFASTSDALTWRWQAEGQDREDWLAEGFVARGLPQGLSSPELIALVGNRDPTLAANAEALLRTRLGGPGEMDLTPVRRVRAWKRWWDLNQHRFGIADIDHAAITAQFDAAGASLRTPAAQE